MMKKVVVGIVDRFLKSFYQRHYGVYDPVREKKLGSDWTKWTHNVVFKKTDLSKDRLYQV